MSRVVIGDDERFLVTERLRGARWLSFAELPQRSSSPFSTVPLLCSACGCGFQGEGADQFKSGVANGEVFEGGPQVDDVSLDGALGIETLKDILVQVDAEGPALGGRVMHRTGTAAL